MQIRILEEVLHQGAVYHVQLKRWYWLFWRTEFVVSNPEKAINMVAEYQEKYPKLQVEKVKHETTYKGW